MKKVMRSLIVVLLLFSMLVFTGCSSEIKPTDENSHLVSIYSLKREQKDSGEVVNTDLVLKQTVQILKTEIIKLDYETVELVDYDGDTFEVEGKYTYSSLPVGAEMLKDKIIVFPTKDMSIMVRERTKKDINIYYQGKEVASILTEEYAIDYKNYFKNTYSESFYFNGTYVGQILKNVTRNVTIELYTNNNFTGKPFAKGTFTYSSYSKSFSGSISFEMIKTTNVYCRII